MASKEEPMRPTFKTDLIVAWTSVFRQEPKVEMCQGVDREGNPVESLVVEGGLVLYPMKGTKQSIVGTREVTRIAVDQLVTPTGNPEKDADGCFELALLDTDAEAIAFVVAETAREQATQAVTIEQMARELGEDHR